MTCAELENTLALHAGDSSTEASSVLAGHLTACPLCRQKKDDYAEIRRELRQFAAPQIPAAVRADLKTALRTEIRRSERGRINISRDFADWLQMRVMPYSVGVAASVVVGFSLLTLMFSGQLRRADIGAGVRSDNSPVLLAASRQQPANPYDAFELTPTDIVNSRMQFAQESPSINPQGALVALTKSLVRGEMKDEEVVVVADVFSNGLAKISEVVESPKDGRMISELEKALTNDAKFAPFVPTVIEDRPESMQIILRIQNVNVPTGLKPLKRRV
jgi:hypothetical protein